MVPRQWIQAYTALLCSLYPLAIYTNNNIMKALETMKIDGEVLAKVRKYKALKGINIKFFIEEAIIEKLKKDKTVKL